MDSEPGNQQQPAREITAVARRGFGDKVTFQVEGEPEPLVTSVHAIALDTGLDPGQVDGRAFRFTVTVSVETGDPVEDLSGFRLAPGA